MSAQTEQAPQVQVGTEVVSLKWGFYTNFVLATRQYDMVDNPTSDFGSTLTGQESIPEIVHDFGNKLINVFPEPRWDVLCRISPDYVELLMTEKIGITDYTEQLVADYYAIQRKLLDVIGVYGEEFGQLI